MSLARLLVFGLAGVFSGLLAGLLGIGGGTVLVPILITLGYTPLQAVATSSLAIVITSLSGSFQNWRMGYLDFRQVALLGVPAALTAQVGVRVAGILPPQILLVAFAVLLGANIYLVGLRKRLAQQPEANTGKEARWDPRAAGLFTGSIAGFLAGLLGIGGGVIMVPLQMLLLGEPIKRAIQTSLGVIVITAIASTAGHAIAGNVVWVAGILLGVGGLVGAQFSTRALPKLPDTLVTLLFRSLLMVLVVYTLWQAIGQ